MALRIYVTSIVYFIFWNLKWNDLDNHPSCLLLLNLLVYLRLPTWLSPVLSFSFLFFFLKANGERRLHLRLYGYIRWRIHSLRYLGPNLWNSLPSNLRNLPSLQSFKRQIRLVNLSLKLKSDCENCVLCSNWHTDWPNCIVYLFFLLLLFFVLLNILVNVNNNCIILL